MAHVFPFLYLSQHSSCLAFKRLLLMSSSYLLPNVTSSLETPLIPKAEGDSLLPMPCVEFILPDERGLSSRLCPHQTVSQTSPPFPPTPPTQLSGERLSSSGDSVWHAGRCQQRLDLGDRKPLHMWPASGLQGGKTGVRATVFWDQLRCQFRDTGITMAQCQGNLKIYQGFPSSKIISDKSDGRRVLWTECLCVLQIHVLKPNAPCDGIWKSDLWEVIRSWGWSPHEWN